MSMQVCLSLLPAEPIFGWMDGWIDKEEIFLIIGLELKTPLLVSYPQ